MAIPFSQTLRSLQNNRGWGALVGVILCTLLLGVWVLWMVRARVNVYVVSATTRLEVRGAVYPIHTEVAGRLAVSHLSLNQVVQPGEVLFELDTTVQQSQLAEERARLSVITPRIAAVKLELEALLGAIRAELFQGRVTVDVARAKSREAQVSARVSKSEAERFAQLKKMTSEMEIERFASTADERLAAADASTLDVKRLAADARARTQRSQVQLAEQKQVLAELTGQQTTIEASIAVLGRELERRRIRAPAAGRIGELLQLRAGMYLAEGERVGALMPTDELQLVASFDPAEALGRLQPGQKAELRLSGFPWIQYGTVNARVKQVASEIRDQQLRAEFELTSDARSLIPLQHGMSGTVEVIVGAGEPGGAGAAQRRGGC